MNLSRPLVAVVCLLLAVCFATHAADHKQTKTPTILEDPLLHLGFAWHDIGAWTEQAAKDVKGELDKVALGDTGKWLNQAGADIGQWTAQAAKDIKAETDKIDLTSANEWIGQAAENIGAALDNMDGDDFGKWLKRASKDIGLRGTVEDLRAVKLEEVPSDVLRFINENPAQTVFYVVEGVVFFAPGVVYGPILGLLGFGAGGVHAGSAAAAMQRGFGSAVPVGSLFAGLTSAGAGRYGAATLSMITRREASWVVW